MVLSCDAMRGNCDNCSYTHTQARLQKSDHCTCQYTDTGKLVLLFMLGHSLSTG